MTQCDRVLTMLEEASDRGVTTADFLRAYIPRFSARIMELRNLGHQIDAQRLSQSSHVYKLRPVTQSVRVESGEPSGPAAGGKLPPDGLRGSSRGEGVVPRPEPSPGAAAATSGERAKTGGSASPGTPSDPPALFELPATGPRSHYEEEAA